jgi:hypothetical protein
MKSIKRHKRRATTIGMTCLALLNIAVFAAPAAHAESGRRICMYGSTRNVYYASNGSLFGHFNYVMDYKKKGGCPDVRNASAIDAGSREYATAKVTCEALRDEMHVNWDPCPQMKNDDVYYMEWRAYNGGFSRMNSFGHY